MLTNDVISFEQLGPDIFYKTHKNKAYLNMLWKRYITDISVGYYYYTAWISTLLAKFLDKFLDDSICPIILHVFYRSRTLGFKSLELPQL